MVDGSGDAKGYQVRVREWAEHCFGVEIADDKTERSHRFLEEGLELFQAAGGCKADALALVEYVYGRPVGELEQEVGGTAVTLAAFCEAHGVSLTAAAEEELARCWRKAESIREKQKTKPKGSPLPQ